MVSDSFVRVYQASLPPSTPRIGPPVGAAPEITLRRLLRRCIRALLRGCRYTDLAMSRLVPPILATKDPGAPSAFSPAALLHQARRQKGLAVSAVPATCVLDPDGDIVRWLPGTGQARCLGGWPCYHASLEALQRADADGELSPFLGQTHAVTDP